jgi:hypothetical protein
MVLYLCVLIVFSLHRESLKLIWATNPSPRWFCHSVNVGSVAHYIGAGGGAHCPLIEGIAPDHQEGGLGPLWPKPIRDQLQYSPP